MYILQNKQTFTRFKTSGGFESHAFKNQIVTFKELIYLGVCLLRFLEDIFKKLNTK